MISCTGLYNILNVNTKAKYTHKEVLLMHQNMTNITFKTVITNVLVLGFNYAIEKPTKLYIQDWMIGTGNGTRHVDTEIIIALEQKISPFKIQTQQTFYTKDNYM